MTDKRTGSEGKTLPPWYTPVTEELLQEITRCIVDALHPEKIILFGSNAYGEPAWDSDVDLLVVTNALQHESVFERHRAVSALFPHRRFAMDVLVRTPLELRQQLERGNSLFHEILTRGKVLYERGDSGGDGGVDTQSRGRL